MEKQEKSGSTSTSGMCRKLGGEAWEWRGGVRRGGDAARAPSEARGHCTPQAKKDPGEDSDP